MIGSRTTVVALGTAQTLAWASSYYLPAVLAAPIAGELGVSVPTVFAAFSLALVVSALVGPVSGRTIDARGGRGVLMLSNCIFAAGLTLLAIARGPLGLFAAWACIGVGMGSGLYEAAFATLVRLQGKDARGSITGITLIAGFASTVGWPLTALLDAQIGWRGACLAWAALHVLVGLPLNRLLPRAESSLAAATGAAAVDAGEPVVAVRVRSTTVLLSYVFAATWFVSTAMAAHLPRLLQASGASLAAAVAIGALVGPAQVFGRVLEFGLLRRVHPLLSARLAALLHPVGVGLLALFGVASAAPFALLHGIGNGVLTIAKGTLPLAFFGARGYGLRQGLLTVPARFAQAAAPWLFGLCIDRWGASAMVVSAAVGLSAFLALLVLRRPR